MRYYLAAWDDVADPIEMELHAYGDLAEAVEALMQQANDEGYSHIFAELADFLETRRGFDGYVGHFTDADGDPLVDVWIRPIELEDRAANLQAELDSVWRGWQKQTADFALVRVANVRFRELLSKVLETNALDEADWDLMCEITAALAATDQPKGGTE